LVVALAALVLLLTVLLGPSPPLQALALLPLLQALALLLLLQALVYRLLQALALHCRGYQ
jgi:hypothetical protein